MLNNKMRIAIEILCHLNEDEPISLVRLAPWVTASILYQEQIITLLGKAGLVTGMRGPGGGYTLSRHPKEITVADIVKAFSYSIPNKQGYWSAYKGLVFSKLYTVNIALVKENNDEV